MAINFPLNLWDISLLLAATAVILLVTSELLSPYYGSTNLTINKKKLGNAAIAAAVLFLVFVAIRIVGLLLNL